MWASSEAAIIARLRARLPADVHVGSMDDTNAVSEMRQRAPAVWVIYDGIRPGESANNSKSQQVIQEWYAVVTTRSAKGNGSNSTARDAASALCEQVIVSLIGHHIGGGKYLRLGESPGPEYDAGYCIVPIAFTCAAIFYGAT